MQKLFLHIGTHKTGTSAFQKLIFREKFKLARQDNLFVINLNTFPAAKKLMTADVYRQELVEDLAGFFRDKIRGTKGKFLVSYEGLSGNMATLYANTEVVARMLHESTRAYDTEILVFLRRQDEFLQSVYTQKIHEGKSFSIDEFMARNSLENLDWNSFLKPFLSHFGHNSVHVFPYDRAVLHQKTVAELLNMVVNSVVLANAGEEQVNVGFSPVARQIAEDLNPELSTLQQRYLRTALQKISNKGFGREYNILPHSPKKEIISRFREPNRLLATRYFSDRFGISDFSEPVYENDVDEPGSDKEYRNVVKYLLALIEEREEKTAVGTFLSRCGRKIYQPVSRIVKRAVFKLD